MLSALRTTVSRPSVEPLFATPIFWGHLRSSLYIHHFSGDTYIQWKQTLVLKLSSCSFCIYYLCGRYSAGEKKNVEWKCVIWMKQGKSFKCSFESYPCPSILMFDGSCWLSGLGPLTEGKWCTYIEHVIYLYLFLWYNCRKISWDYRRIKWGNLLMHSIIKWKRTGLAWSWL